MSKADTVIVSEQMSVALCLWTLKPILSSWGHKKASSWCIWSLSHPLFTILFGVLLTSKVYFLTTRNFCGLEQVASQSKCMYSFYFRLLLLRPRSLSSTYLGPHLTLFERILCYS